MTASRIGVLAIVLAACGSPARRPPHVYVDAPPVGLGVSPPLVFGPIVRRATLYNEPLAPSPWASWIGVDRSTPHDDAVFAGLVNRALGHGLLARDPRLDVVASELATVRGAAPTPSLVEFVMRAHGIVERAERVEVSDGRTAEDVVAELGPALDPVLGFGNVRVGVGGAHPTVVVIAYTSLATVTYAPRYVPRQGGFWLTALVDPSRGAPRVTITHPDGVVEHPEVIVDGASMRAPFACGDREGPQWIGIEAGADQTPIALFPVDCATQPAATYRIEPAANLAVSEDPAAVLMALIDRERGVRGLAPLHPDVRVMAAAKRYAELMRAQGSVSHELGGTTPVTRLIAANLDPPLVLESTMMVDHLGHAAELLLDDPKYRDDVVSTAVTHVGVAVVADARGELYIAILYVRIPPLVDPLQLTHFLAGELRDPTAPNPVRIDTRLGKIATHYAQQLAIGWRQDILWPVIKFELDDTSSRFSKMGDVVKVTLDPTTIPPGDLVDNKDPDAIGIGVAQSPRDGALAGRIWIVVIYGED